LDTNKTVSIADDPPAGIDLHRSVHVEGSRQPLDTSRLWIRARFCRRGQRRHAGRRRGLSA